MLSKTKIEERLKKKTNSVLVETILLAKKSGNLEIASALSAPTKQNASVNLDKISHSKAETIIIPGKVLSGGEITRKAKIYALGCSEKAKEKMKKAGCEYKTILEALNKNEKIKGEIIR